jgi:transposase
VNRGDLEREQDIEELSTIALAQHAQIQALLEIVAAKSREVEKLRGSAGDLQLTRKMLAELQAKAKATADKIEKAKAKPKDAAERKTRSTTGPTPQPLLPAVEREFTLDHADRACPSCGGNLQPMKGQFDESEMVDVIEVRYELVKVKQQKYLRAAPRTTLQGHAA